MHALTTPAAADPTEDVTWTTPESRLWVATRASSFVGLIEFTENHFLVTDSTRTVIGTFAGLAQAKAALEG
ncbi:hypothetical protein ACFVU2_03150 [Leifsonia sp. NPDC058194]|uniref:hypothetical protein n=1 Tax=Leifsonia sp. NPDC058194 TaxID=3346374 RepID=UPI0036DE2D0F